MDFKLLCREGRMICGLNQARKLIRKGCAEKVYLASDSAISLQLEIVRLSEEHSVSVDTSFSMEGLGAACGLDVGCAAAVLLSQN